MNFITLALKNLLRRRGRTILTILGVAIAVAVLFSLLSFNSGYERQLSGELDSLGIHILAVPKGCPYEAASLIIHGGVIPKYLSSTDLELARKIDGIDVASPMLLHQFIKDDKPHIVYGINMSESLKLRPWWKVIDGRFFSDDEDKVMVIGSSLAEKEKLKAGDTLPFGPDKIPFTIVGVLEQTGTQDDEFHFLPLPVAQQTFNKPDQITTIAIRVKDVSQISAIGKQLETIPDIQVVTMTQVMGTIMNLVGSARTLLMSVIVVAIIISAVGIMNTLLMSVNERTREFGMMKAIGASGTDIGKLVLIETLFITVIGGISGLLLAALGSSLIEGLVKGIIPYAPAGKLMTLQPGLIGICLAFSVIIGFVCGIFPAIKSSRLTPMEAIRSNLE
ncbi:MAG: ABC transporter permease [Chloroflexi bacterium]|nr:ABC transporter permease [Chloroflexota bacterium]